MYLTVMLINYSVMDQAVSHRPQTVEARIRAHVNTCGIFGRQSGTWTGCFLSSSVSPVSIIPSWLSIFIYHLGNEQVCRWRQFTPSTWTTMLRNCNYYKGTNSVSIKRSQYFDMTKRRQDKVCCPSSVTSRNVLQNLCEFIASPF
jgi:hypothetical protein